MKKAQIGSTLTWFVAFIIIFFVMIIFLSTSVISSGLKKVSAGWDEVILQKYDSSLRSEKVLISILNSNFEFNGEIKKLKDWFYELDLYNLDKDKKNELKEKIKSFIFNNSKPGECYVFLTSGADEDSLGNVPSQGQGYVIDFLEKSSIRTSSYEASNIDSRGLAYFESANSKLLKKATKLNLLRNTKKNVFGVEEKNYQRVYIKFYIGEC